MNHDDYVHIDQHNSRVEFLEGRIKELEEGITEQDNARIDLLAELIQLRRTYGADPCLAEDLTALINWHSQMDRRLADEQLRVVL